MANIIPLTDKVVVQSETKEETTSSGFIVAASEKESRPQSGKITAIGPDVTSVAIGEEVIFKEFIEAFRK